jgi:hypothetical protein
MMYKSHGEAICQLHEWTKTFERFGRTDSNV